MLLILFICFSWKPLLVSGNIFRVFQLFHLLGCVYDDINDTIDKGYNQMYWYRQRPGETMTLVVYTFQTDVGHFQSSVDHDRNSFTLSISRLLVSDSSTYYCAARHSDIRCPLDCGHRSHTDPTCTFTRLFLVCGFGN
uniref:Ig-like domain-containing protein n=1 Tax=Poecilia reticulata TaxID=8081 RepID=A0A3P9NUP9_POERE